ncbi:MAG: hypothetical protein Fues2KO_30900 [Fuerstiella sp.]
MSISKYISAAFRNRWNLLGLLGGVGFSLLSGRPEIGLSLVAAAEVAWLGLIATHPKFQQYIDVAEQQELRSDDARTAAARMRRMMSSLPRGAQQRFNELMERCNELRTIAEQYRDAHQHDTAPETFSELRLDGLDRLLWLFLKLLYTENSLNRFFETTTMDEIEREIRQVQARLKREHERPENQQRQRIIATLQDSLKTCEQRRVNFQQARDSYELVKAEQKRLEHKIRSIAETGISKGDPSTFSHEVDSVTGSIHDTEKTLSELEFVTGFSTSEDEIVPEIVPRKVTA